METLLTAVIVLGLMGFVFAALLALASDYFRVEEDPRIAEIMKILPGANCGACGAAGCHDFASKLIAGEKESTGCTVGGQDVACKLSVLMGQANQTVIKKIAAVRCGANENRRIKKAKYDGVKTCAAANLISGGGLACLYGCLGYGDCLCVCPFDAIKMENGLPVIDLKKCTACGKCVTACPRGIISLRPHDFKVVIACSSRDTGAQTRKNCPVGCIACGICAKAVPEVFAVSDNLAAIDYSKTGVDCSAAIQKCPTKCIVEN
ncbi:hypothetical protein A2276_00970 [candidate division WOR-1 bacterium RIFOXYA12_FULL_43_27]|uniref:Ion-translocating oxidoreductase complex subunit B n=1 Tax=candidate division WOR-1 bacterium RIFOXYC2_FULL_46_14 TaxID=1802587 RepID=A0A1F4U4Y6_UNCSA|nr:MAG: hypothetical protein A2276_00970 [candidate division WOR-1 bacterium RIFOXYA12_FULL_43_27]OGC20743.1 MAG: hypothetical protein A2292_06905 [candidate division WOR-1 bacterium RIFOXYB2_FULL_46_45]OGC31520.1 MAG: hypothetical protein A2232_04545 [candidate division WOR-1 bacterium RIFOXYA2_FULL_46_56]OGC39927.1 MAG: hypothetical protein A2438_05385 [candidate division WOR-1 bacterium RIFOXYC2_FULL_46_14]